LLCNEPHLRNNLIASVYLSSAIGFACYLITFYIKYFKGNVFLNFASLGLADALSFLYITKLSLHSQIPRVMRILLVGSIVSCVLFVLTQALWPALLPVCLVLMRLNVGGLFNYNYHYNSKLFPVLAKGAVFAVANSIARPSQALATMAAEYVHEPIFLILTVSIVSISVTYLVSERKV